MDNLAEKVDDLAGKVDDVAKKVDDSASKLEQLQSWGGMSRTSYLEVAKRLPRVQATMSHDHGRLWYKN